MTRCRDKRDLLQLSELSAHEIESLIDRAAELKAIRKAGGDYTPLRGRTLAMIFEKASTRTRVSFDVGMVQLGGHAIVLARQDLQIGRGETIADTARVLSRYIDGIMIRAYEHANVEELAANSDVPVINGLTDLTHPCQVLSDLFTCYEIFGRYADLRIAYIGDGNNMANSWINAAAVAGFELAIACPEGYRPDSKILEDARAAGARIEVTDEPIAAARDAHVVNTDVWASMGQEDEAAERRKVFAPFQVDARVMAAARDDAAFLHCLPAHRGEEVAAEVMDGPQSHVFQQAENRLHCQKAILDWLIPGR